MKAVCVVRPLLDVALHVGEGFQASAEVRSALTVNRGADGSRSGQRIFFERFGDSPLFEPTRGNGWARCGLRLARGRKRNTAEPLSQARRASGTPWGTGQLLMEE